MNTTKNISMGGYAFVIEEDAYQRLKTYTDSVKRNLAGSQGADEIMADIEVRIAEIFREHKGGREVVNNEDVTAVITRMGEPEVYVQDDSGASASNTTQPERDEAGGPRRLYRNPDNKILGGVCGGLGAYAGIDPIWFRLAFAIAFLGYGTGLMLYIVLWVIIPAAKTRLQKLQMQGKRPDLKNIEHSIRSEFKGVGDNLNKMADEKKLREGVNRVGGVVNEVLTRLFVAIGKILEVALKVFAGIVAVGSLVFLVFVVFMLVSGIHSIEISGSEVDVHDFRSYMAYLFESPGMGRIFQLFAFLFLAIPALALLANSIRYLANIQVKPSKWFTVAGLAIWLLATVGLSYMAIDLALNFTKSATGKSETVIVLPEQTPLYLRVQSPENLPKEGLTLRDINLDLRETRDSVFVLKVYRESMGRTESDAEMHLKEIVYKPEVSDSVLIFPDRFMIPAGARFRSQSVNMELRIPQGRKIYIEEGMGRLLSGVINVQNMFDSEMPGRFWIMTDKGLSCENCPVPAPSENSDTVTSKLP